MPDRIPCPTCGRLFGTAVSVAQHARDTHANPDWVAAKTQHRTVPECPRCGRLAAITMTRYGQRANCCGLYSWGLKPLVDDATHRARNAAHAAFDPIWQRGTCSRGEAYRRLQRAMGMTPAECHISVMSADQALRAVEIVRSGALVKDLTDA